MSDDEAPELENKIIFCYNTLTSKLLVRYYYRFVRVNSARGRCLLGSINHELATASDENNDLIVERSTFMYK